LSSLRYGSEDDLTLIMENFVLAPEWDYTCSVDWEMVLEDHVVMTEKEEEVFQSGVVTNNLDAKSDYCPIEVMSSIEKKK